MRRFVAALALLPLLAAPARADGDFLSGIKRFTLLGSTVPANGDQNPYAVVVAPVSAGTIQKDDVLITNFNDKQNLQGLGTTIMSYRPSTRQMQVFASLPRTLPECPGGVGLTTALTMLSSGWIVVGSLPSQDGTTATKGPGCLMVLDSSGKLSGVIKGPLINGPWGNMAVLDEGSRATLFVSNTGFGVGAPGQPVVNQANVIRIRMTIPPNGAPRVTEQTVVAHGFGQLADDAVFVIGPTGLALGRSGELYVSDAIGNRIARIPDAMTRTTSGGTGETVTEQGLLKRPLAMVTAPNGNLVVTNAQNGQAVEIDPRSGKQLHALWIDTSRAQVPPGNGNLFGIAMTPDGTGFYYVKDEINALVMAR